MSRSTALFYEAQQLSPKLKMLFTCMLLLAPAIVMVVFGYGIYQQVYQGKPFGNTPMSNNALMGLGVGMLLLTMCTEIPILLIIRNMTLTIELNRQQLEVKASLFGDRKLKLRDISHYELVEKMRHYGIKYKLRQGWVVNLAGRQGVTIHTKDGKKYTVGSPRASELIEALDQLKEDRPL